MAAHAIRSGMPTSILQAVGASTIGWARCAVRFPRAWWCRTGFRLRRGGVPAWNGRRGAELYRLADLSTEILDETSEFVHAMAYRAGSYVDRTPLMREIW